MGETLGGAEVRCPVVDDEVVDLQEPRRRATQQVVLPHLAERGADEREVVEQLVGVVEVLRHLLGELPVHKRFDATGGDVALIRGLAVHPGMDGALGWEQRLERAGLERPCVLLDDRHGRGTRAFEGVADVLQLDAEELQPLGDVLLPPLARPQVLIDPVRELLPEFVKDVGGQVLREVGVERRVVDRRIVLVGDLDDRAGDVRAAIDFVVQDLVRLIQLGLVGLALDIDPVQPSAARNICECVRHMSTSSGCDSSQNWRRELSFGR